jgi:hypothetical protein
VCIGEVEIDEIRTSGELDGVEGQVVSFRLCPLADLILKPNSLSVSMIMKMKEYVETVRFSKLERNLTKELMIEMKKAMEKNKGKLEICNSLQYLLSTMSFRGAIHKKPGYSNCFFEIMRDSLLMYEIENE